MRLNSILIQDIYVLRKRCTYRLFQYPLHELSDTIKRLAVHNKNEQNIYFREE